MWQPLNELRSDKDNEYRAHMHAIAKLDEDLISKERRKWGEGNMRVSQENSFILNVLQHICFLHQVPSGRREEWRVKMVKEEESHNCRNLPNKRRKRLKKLNTRWNLQPFYLFHDLEFSFSVSRSNLHKNSFLIQIDVRCNKKDRDGDCEMRMSTKKNCQDSQS